MESHFPDQHSWSVARDGTVEPATPQLIREEKPLWRKFARLLWLPFMIIWKGKAVVLMLAKIKGLTTLATMLLSVGAYALIWGWVFAVGFVALLFVHELGHALVLRRQGVKTSPILFIPFLGAVIAMKQMPKDAYKEAQMALGGPLLGSLGALGCLLAAYATGSDLLQALAYTGFLLNLFNLIPVVPLDGGRAVAAIHPGIWYFGVALLLGVVVWWQSWILLALFVFFLLPELIHRLKERRQESVRQDYYGLRTRTRVAVGGVYLGLSLALGGGMYISYLPHADGEITATSAVSEQSNQRRPCVIYHNGKNWVGGHKPTPAARFPKQLEVKRGANGADDIVYVIDDGRKRVDISVCLPSS